MSSKTVGGGQQQVVEKLNWFLKSLGRPTLIHRNVADVDGAADCLMFKQPG